MLTSSKFRLFSFWVILFIVVKSQCYNDGYGSFNYSNSSILKPENRRSGNTTITELPSTVNPSLNNNNHLPDFTSEPVPAAPTPPLSSGDGHDTEQHGQGMPEEEVPRNATPPVRDLEANQPANSSRPTNDGSSRVVPAGRPLAVPALAAAAAAAALLVGARRVRKPRGYIFVWECVRVGGPRPTPTSPPDRKNREIRGLPLPKLTELTDDIHQRIAEKLRLSQECRSAKLRDQWTTRATLSLPLDNEEILETMGNSMVKTSSDLAVSVPSTMMEPEGAIDDWLLSFITYGEFIKSGPLPLLENTLETTSPTQSHIKQPFSPEMRKKIDKAKSPTKNLDDLCEASTTLSDDSGARVESAVRKVWNKVLAPSSGLSESTTNDTPFFEIWGSLIGAAYLAECYGAEIGVDISMEEIVEHPSMRLQSELVRKKWVMQNRGSRVNND
ncbi:hypothetical protein F5882DRAFT_442431 [Hyaloscypha sp. PMI_1271]|nr:hypothetical protein F5882DRAFT_442431 [Hyaloscypha sp. PMI_1271]